jgi:hypothetical protein
MQHLRLLLLQRHDSTRIKSGLGLNVRVDTERTDADSLIPKTLLKSVEGISIRPNLENGHRQHVSAGVQGGQNRGQRPYFNLLQLPPFRSRRVSNLRRLRLALSVFLFLASLFVLLFSSTYVPFFTTISL